jgi:hypothetical protein
MKKMASLVLGSGLLLALPTFSNALTLEGHFSGYADHAGAPGVYAPGMAYTARLILNTVQTNPWYPWDPTKQYTAVINATVASYIGGYMQSVDFANGAQFRIYEDTGTAADYAIPATFTDGTLVLSGGSNDYFGQRVDIFGLPWNFYGTIVFVGGAGLGNLADGCQIGLAMNDFVNFQIGSFPPGYEEAYDAEWKCEAAIANDEPSWGGVKSLYR